MKNQLALILGAALLAGCSPFYTVPLYRDYTPYDAFLFDRQACVSEARRCVIERYANSSYNGETADKLLPSRRVYLGCMSGRGYYPVVNGFVPPVLALMNDYAPGSDCFSR